MINNIEKVGTHNLYEIDLKLSGKNATLPEIGSSVETIFFVTSLESQHLLYMNHVGLTWLDMEHENVDFENIRLRDYFESEFGLEEKSCVESGKKEVNLSLQKVWFQSELDFKLCLVSRLTRMNDNLYLIIPLKDWQHFKQRLANLLEEEVFIERNAFKYQELTKREKQVVRLISAGLNSREISDKLFISRHTVEQHRKNINRKLEVNSVAELVEYGRVFS